LNLTSRHERWIFGAAVALGTLPLWVGGHLPLVDLPQHLHLISVLHRLDDPTTLYPQTFAARGQLTPYLGYYWSVSLLHWLFPLELANRLFLAAYVAGLPLAMAFLLRALSRPTWPALLTVPFAYGDSFAWGFINYCSALPLGLLALGFTARGVAKGPAARLDALGLALSLTAVLLFHVQVYAFAGLGVVWLAAATRAPAGPWLRARAHVAWATLPSLALFLGWVGLRLGEPSQVEAGAPWKAWGPMLSAENLAFKGFAQNLGELYSVLGNHLRDGGDRLGVLAVFAVAAAALALFAARPGERPKDAGRLEPFRLAGLTLLALALFFLLPFDIRGYIYYLNTRYAHLAAALAVASVPVLAPRFRPAFLVAAAASVLVVVTPLARGFFRFGQEAKALSAMTAATAAQPRVMALIFDARSAVVNHPVYLHAGAELARSGGGLTNFSFALTPHSPVRYVGDPPPTFPSEWRPHDFRYDAHGAAYDHFLVRGPHPARVFGPLLGDTLMLTAQSGGFYLVRRRP
jgi:hypothetical protein